MAVLIDISDKTARRTNKRQMFRCETVLVMALSGGWRVGKKRMDVNFDL